MAIANNDRFNLLAIVLLASISGCARRPLVEHGCGSPGDGCAIENIASGVYQGTLADEVMCCDTGCLSQTGCGCTGPVHSRFGPDCYQCGGCSLVPFGLGDTLCNKPQAGPPPVRLRPEMPPKFLPVPTQPILSPVRPDAPDPVRGDVEVGYRNQLTFPGHD